METLHKNRIKYFFFLHFFSLLITGVVTTVMLYQKYNYGEQKKDFFYKYQKFEKKSNVLRLYSRYTGTETAFGFFAPNVKSHDYIFFEACGIFLELPYETYEGELRFNCMIGSATDYVLDEIKGKSKKTDLKQRFSDLLLQNLVSKVKQTNQLEGKCNSVEVTYKILEYPPLESNIFPKNPELISLKNWLYETE